MLNLQTQNMELTLNLPFITSDAFLALGFPLLHILFGLFILFILSQGKAWVAPELFCVECSYDIRPLAFETSCITLSNICE